MAKKTKDYDLFIFREDNREKIIQSHVQRLIESITSRNLLDLRPIIVNEKMEIIDGQHRLLAAKSLGVEIYYDVSKNLGSDEILLMNNAKAWGDADFLNFYCKNEYPEYKKLAEFMKKQSLTLRVALNICIGQIKLSHKDFKEGRFVFSDEPIEENLQICWDTINYIKRMNGFSAYTTSSRFWKALLKLVNHEDFDEEKWRANLTKMVERFCAKATTSDYTHLMLEVHNWRNNSKIKDFHEEY